MTKNYFDTYSIFIIFIILHPLKTVKYYRNHRGKLRPSQHLKLRKSHTERLESNLKKIAYNTRSISYFLLRSLKNE